MVRGIIKHMILEINGSIRRDRKVIPNQPAASGKEEGPTTIQFTAVLTERKDVC